MLARSLLASAASATALLFATQAAAHAHLVSSNPAADTTLAAPPKTIALTFNEKLVPAFSKFTVVMPDMNNMPMKVKTTVSKDGKSIVGTPQGGMMKGAYKVVWQAASADGHKMTGEVAFRVG